MSTEDEIPEELEAADRDMLKTAKSVYEILNIWATSKSLVRYSTGVGGLKVEGTIQLLRAPEDDSWGLLDASFLFSSRTGEIAAYIHLEPKVKIRTKPDGEVEALEFGPDGDRCILRPARRHGPNPDDLQKVLEKLKQWAERKMKVWINLDLGFSASASFCDIEEISDGAFGLTEEGSSRSYSVFPGLSSRASLEDIEGTFNKHQPD